MLSRGSKETADPDYLVTLRSNVSGNPGPILSTLTKPSALAAGEALNQFRVPGAGFDLESGTTYFVLIEPTKVTGRRAVSLRMTDRNNEDSGRALGWSVGDSSRFQPDAESWSTHNDSGQIAVRGYAVPSAPDTPAQVLVGAEGSVTENSLTVSWTAPTDIGSSAITDYDVRYFAGSAAPADDSADWIEATEQGGIDHVGAGTESTFSGLTASTTYWVQVRASNSEGTGAWSPAARGVTAPSGHTVSSLVSNTAQFIDSFVTWRQIGKSRHQAQAFTTGSSANGYKLTSVNVRIGYPTTQATVAEPDYTVTVHEAATNGNPGTSLGTLTNPPQLVSGINVFTTSGTGIDLAADTTYMVVIVPTVTDERRLTFSRQTSFNREDDGAAAGWSVADVGRGRLEGNAWANIGNASYMIAVRGYIKPAPPGVPGTVNAGATGDITATSFTVSWTAPPNPGSSAITDYDVRYYGGSAAPADDSDDWIEAGETGGHDHVGTATEAVLSG